MPADSVEEKNALSALEDLAAQLSGTSVVWCVDANPRDVSQGDLKAVISGTGGLEEEISGFRFRITPNAFFQTNSSASPLLLNTVGEYVGNSVDGTLLDLYCGTGFFAVSLAGRAQRTIGVELVADAVADARINAQQNNVTVEFHQIKAEDYSWSELRPAVVIVDPPRPGLHDKALKALLDLLPPRIVYVSCNYKSLAREMTFLSKHYNVPKIRAIDQFPHTPHVEVVALLERR